MDFHDEDQHVLVVMHADRACTSRPWGHRELVEQVSEHVNLILRYLPYVQTNFVLGLDCDEGEEPFGFLCTVDAERDAPLAKALHVESYPTLVFAAPDGKSTEVHVCIDYASGRGPRAALASMVRLTSKVLASNWRVRKFSSVIGHIPSSRSVMPMTKPIRPM